MSSSNSPSGSAPAARPRRRWLQYSLRSLFVLTAICAVLTWRGVTWYRQMDEEDAAIATLRAHGIEVVCDFPTREGYVKSPPAWFLWLVGKRHFSHAYKVDFSGPDPLTGTWETTTPKIIYTTPSCKDAALLAYLPGLHTLELYGKGIDDDALSALRGATHLKELTLCATSIKGTGFAAMAQVPLETLVVESHYPFSDEGYAGLAHIRALKKLEFYFAADCSPSRMKQFGKVDHKAIDASSFSPMAFAEIGKLPQLEQLYVHGPSVTDEGVAQLTELKKLWSLELIDVAITDEAFASLAKMTALTDLKIESNSVTGEGVKYLADTPIESLILDGTNFQASTCIHAAKMKNLKRGGHREASTTNIPWQ